MGSFNSAVLDGLDGSTAASLDNFTLNGVTYTGGSYYTAFLGATGGTSAIGSMSLSFSGISPNLSINAGTGDFNNFTTPTAGSTGTFDAISGTAVPEPSSMAVYALGAFGILGLALRGRRQAPAAL
jgi:hypothetical protein